MKQKLLCSLLALAMLMSVPTGCGNKAPENAGNPPQQEAPAGNAEKDPAPEKPAESPAEAPSDTRTIVDLQGNEVTIPAETKKIASGKANLTQITLILGGVDAVATLGQGADCSEGKLMHDMFPELHNLEIFTEQDMNMESLLNIAPDLVMIYGSAPSNDLSEQLKDRGFAVAICNLANEKELLQTMEIFSNALGEGTKDKLAAYQKFYQGIMDDVAAKSAGIADADKPKVAFMRPNGAVCSANSMPHNWITAAGGINIGETAGIQPYAAEMTAEELLNYNPDIIFCESPQTLEFLAGEAYQSLKAVTDKALYVVPYGLSCSGLANAENPLVWQWAANIIQPNIYSYDAGQTVKDFYKDFYGYGLSDAQLEKIMYPAGK